jgi:hypothetical protein
LIDAADTLRALQSRCESAEAEYSAVIRIAQKFRNALVGKDMAGMFNHGLCAEAMSELDALTIPTDERLPHDYAGEVARLEARVQALEAALAKFGKHADKCVCYAWNRCNHAGACTCRARSKGCDCGLAAALAVSPTPPQSPEPVQEAAEEHHPHCEITVAACSCDAERRLEAKLASARPQEERT